MDFRFIEQVDVFLCFSEKQIAALGFLNLDGKLDYASFKTQDSTTLEWAKELYTYYWNMSSEKIPDQLSDR
jgi:predicted transcriptional regulator